MSHATQSHLRGAPKTAATDEGQAPVGPALTGAELEPNELAADGYAAAGVEAPAKAAEAISDAFSGNAGDKLTGHAYDGIEEYDNPMPGWWSWLFVATIVFGLAYAFVSLVMQEDWGARSEYAQALQAEELRRLGDIGVLEPTRETFLTVANGPLANFGKGVFVANCAACHGSNGAGSLTAPNMTDDHYLNVRKLEDIYDVVANGRKNGAMPAWKNRLSSNDVILVTGYVASLKGTHVPGGKAAEGTKVEGGL